MQGTNRFAHRDRLARWLCGNTPSDLMTEVPDSGLIYKILTVDQWTAAQLQGVFVGSPDDLRDGFIHFSTAEQVPGTLTKHFARHTSLILLTVAAKNLGPALKWEASRGGALFPHLYGPLEVRHISRVTAIPETQRETFLPSQDII